MPRIKQRTFDGGLHLTSAPDDQPLNTVRRARNIICRHGKVRCAPPSVNLTGAEATPGVTVSSFTRFADSTGTYRTYAAGATLRRFDGSIYNTVTLPTGIALSGSSNPLVFIPATPTDGKKEFMFVVDSGGNGAVPETHPDIGHLFKVDNGGAATRWGILPPLETEVEGIVLTKTAQNSKFINTIMRDPFGGSTADGTDETDGADTANWTLASGDEDTINTTTPAHPDEPTFSHGEDNPSIDGMAIKLRVQRDRTAQITRVFGSNVDLTTFGAVSSPDEDFIQFYVRVRRPKHVQSMEIAFDTTAAGDFKKDFFSRELTFKLVKRKRRKKLIGMGDLIPARTHKRGTDTAQFLAEHADKLRDLTFQAAQGETKIEVARNTWSRVTIPKAIFDESGSPSWATVRAVRITVETNSQGRAALFFDDLKIVGGVGMVGDYSYTITFRRDDTGTRSNPNIDQRGNIALAVDANGNSGITNVERQGVRLTFPALTFDPQVTHIEIWRTVGNGGNYFRAGTIAVAGGVLGAGTTFDDVASDYIGLHSTSKTDTVAGNNTSFAVLEPEELPLDNNSPNDPAFRFRDAAGPHYGRMFWTNNVDVSDGFGQLQDARGLVYYSPAGRREAVVGFLNVSAGISEPVRKIAIWNDRLFAFTKSALYEIVGTDEPFVAQRVEGAPGTNHPFSVCATPYGLFYFVIGDGIYRFNGTFAENITNKDLMPLIRESEGDTLEGLLGSQVLSEIVYGRDSLWCGNIGGGGAQFTYIYDFRSQTWRYREIGRALYFDSNTGQILQATTTNTLRDLEPLTFNTGGTPHFMEVSTPAVRAGSGQKGILRKVFIEYRPVTESAITLTVYVDEQVVLATLLSAATSLGVSDRRTAEFNINTAGEWFQVNVSGSNINNAAEIYGIEFDIHVGGQVIEDSGLTTAQR